MRVLYAVLCEDAHMDEAGRVDLHGVFHHLFAPGFPAQQERMTLAAAVEWDAGEVGQVEFRIDLLDPSRSPALTINGHTEVGGRSPGQPPPRTVLVMPLERVIFPAEGTYEFELNVAGEKVRVAPLHLIEEPQAR